MQNGITPLFIASQKGHTSVVSLLLDKGAAVDLPDKVRINNFTCLVETIHSYYVIHIIHVICALL